MKPLPKHNLSRRSLVRIWAVAALVMIALANGLDGPGARAAMRLPEEAMSLEPWAFPADVIPALVDTKQLAPPQDGPRRTASVGSPKTGPDRTRRQNFSRTEKRALVEFMGLSEEQPFMRSFESFQSCRSFVAINC